MGGAMSWTLANGLLLALSSSKCCFSISELISDDCFTKRRRCTARRQEVPRQEVSRQEVSRQVTCKHKSFGGHPFDALLGDLGVQRVAGASVVLSVLGGFFGQRGGAD